MARVLIDRLNKVYPNGVHSLKDVSLDIHSGEFIVLVGPSGCGKSTLLRTLAGLENSTSGVISIGGKRVSDLHPSQRGIAMVFQDYALYPHMTVYENLAFGLRIKKYKSMEIQKKIHHISEILALTPLLQRKPSQLSGGQRQRVAIGRALVKEPAVFLLDEPLSNLDTQLRVQTRLEIAALHRKIGSTTIYVTHDQEEAMTLGDRIAVLSRGELQQFDSPTQLYEKPRNRFTASFLGAPKMNFIEGQLRTVCGKRIFQFSDMTVDVPKEYHTPDAGSYILGLRPESVQMGTALKGILILTEFYGYAVHAIIEVGEKKVIMRISNSEQMSTIKKMRLGDPIYIQFDLSESHWFYPDDVGNRVTDAAMQCSFNSPKFA
jgi:ABC-type sugar transport system ATPase subunit